MVKELKKKKSRKRKKSALAKLLTVALFRCHTTEKNQQKALNKSFLQKRRKITNSEKKKFFSKSRHFLKKRGTFASDKPSEMCLRRNHFYLAEKESVTLENLHLVWSKKNCKLLNLTLSNWRICNPVKGQISINEIRSEIGKKIGFKNNLIPCVCILYSLIKILAWYSPSYSI